jgi:hypothetical protein
MPQGQVKKRYTHFGVDIPLGWQQKSFRGADLFFEHQSRQATIFINAECDKFSDSPLSVLTSQLLVGLSTIKYLKEEVISLSDREALLSELNASVDGVERFLKIMVMRKNRCVFDAVFNASPDQKYLSNDFDHFIKSFWAEASL